MARRVATPSAYADLKRAADIVKYALKNSFYTNPVTGERVKIINGLLSGWAFTSVFGSLFSYGMITSAIELAETFKVI